MNKDLLLLQSQILKKITDNLCELLPQGEIYNISLNLKHCISNLPVIVQEYIQAEDRITRIRKAIQIQIALDECKEYLDFIALTRQSNVNHLLIELNKLVLQVQKSQIHNLNAEEAQVDLWNLN
ncbi:MAG: hypothetical protein ABFD00_09905 [Chloroherpetonaceae bacterium]